MPSSPPYAGLTPAVVLDALDAVGLRGDGRLLQLNSYENRVFQVFLEDGSVVVPKFYRPGRWTDEQILEEHAFALELAAAEIPVVPPLALQVVDDPRLSTHANGTLAEVEVEGQRFRFSVSPRHGGGAPEIDREDTLTWIGRFIGRLHAVGATRPFAHRRRLGVDTLGTRPRDYLRDQRILPEEVAAPWLAAADEALQLVQQAFDEREGLRTLCLHGDCHPGNVLWTPAGPHFVDLDDAMTGPAIQDLWMLLSGEPEAMQRQMNAVLHGYETFCEFDRRELGLIEPLRTLRMIHHSAWLAERWSDPAFPAAFPFFEGSAYWSQQTIQLREQILAMRQPALGASDFDHLDLSDYKMPDL